MKQSKPADTAHLDPAHLYDAARGVQPAPVYVIRYIRIANRDKRNDGNGHCMSDGHYECANCSHLSPEATR